MSRPGGTPDPSDRFGAPCDPEKIFHLASGDPEGLSPDEERETREHLACCSGCRELYERDLDLVAHLNSADFRDALSSRSVCRGVAMALPTRARGARLLWGLAALALLLLAFLALELNGVNPVIPIMGFLGACWSFVAGSAGVARVALAAAGSTILLVLALGTLADLAIAAVVLSVSRNRRTREA